MEINKIIEQYSIDEVTPVKMIRESGDNFVYLIGENHKKILRVSKRLPIEDVQFEYEAIQHLYKNNFPVPEWIKTTTGNFYASAEDISVAVMFDFLDGYYVVADKDNLPTTEQAYTAGKTLGLLAEKGRTFKPTFPRRRNIFAELERVIQNKDIFTKEFDGGKDFVDQVRRAIDFGKENNRLTGLIHNDYRPGNIFFKNDSEISGVIDFDWSCVGPLAKDLALGVLEWSFPDGRVEPDFKIFDAFLDGYNSTSTKIFKKDNELYSWIKFVALSDASTFFCDRLLSANLKKKISYSYMYSKYVYFSKF